MDWFVDWLLQGGWFGIVLVWAGLWFWNRAESVALRHMAADMEHQRAMSDHQRDLLQQALARKHRIGHPGEPPGPPPAPPPLPSHRIRPPYPYVSGQAGGTGGWGHIARKYPDSLHSLSRPATVTWQPLKPRGLTWE